MINSMSHLIYATDAGLRDCKVGSITLFMTSAGGTDPIGVHIREGMVEEYEALLSTEAVRLGVAVPAPIKTVEGVEFPNDYAPPETKYFYDRTNLQQLKRILRSAYLNRDGYPFMGETEEEQSRDY